MQFETGHEVSIPRPIDEVFRVLAQPENLEPLLRLSTFVTSFTLLGTEPGPTPATRVTTFEFDERIPMFPGGLFKARVTMQVEQTVDTEARRVDYWSHTKGGTTLSVHKVRTFAPAGDATKVSEVIHGEAPYGIHLIAGRTARKAHMQHMDSYIRLFAD